MSYLPYLCLRIVVSNTYCVVCVFYFYFFFCLFCLHLPSCIRNVVSFSELSIHDCLFVFPNVYFILSLTI